MHSHGLHDVGEAHAWPHPRAVEHLPQQDAQGIHVSGLQDALQQPWSGACQVTRGWCWLGRQCLARP